LKKQNRILSLLLAITMLVTFVTPMSAMGFEPMQEIFDVTGGWADAEDNSHTAPPAQPNVTPPDSGEIPTPEPEKGMDEQDSTEEEQQVGEPNAFIQELERFMKKIDLLEPAPAAFGAMDISPSSGDVGSSIQVSFTNQMGDWNYGGYYGNRWPMISAAGAVAAACAVLDGNDPVNGTYSNRQDASDSVLRLLVAYDKGSYSLRDLQFAIWNISTGTNGGLISAASSADTTGYAAYRWSAGSSAQPIYTLHKVDEPSDPDDPDDPSGDETRIEIETRVEVETTTTIENGIRYSEAWGQITIRKENQNHESLDGAQFDIRLEFANGEVRNIRNWEVDNGARLLTWQHPAGDISPVKVTVTEVRPPQHYTLDPAPQVATVSPTYTTFFIQTTRMWTTEMSFHYHLVFHISGGGGDDGAEPAHAAIPNRANPISDDGWEWIAASSSSGGDGACPICSHEFGPVHNSTQVGSDTQETASMTPGDRETTLTFRNERIRGQLVVTKLCAVTSLPLAGAEFRVDGVDLGNAGSFSQTVTTDADGTATVNGLFPGSYRVTEIGVPSTHNNDAPPQTFAVQSNETVRLTFRNTRRQGLIIHKVDPEGKALQGAVFQVARASGQVLGSFIMDANGLIIIPSNQLATGDYVATEIQAPDGYLIDEANNPQRIFVDNTQQNQNYQLTFRNFRMPSIEIIKVDADNPTIRLEGAVFRISNTRTGQIFEGTTDSNGRVYFPKLDLNTTYMIEEIAPSGGHVNSGFRQEIVLRENRVHTIVVTNSQKPSLTIVKVDEVSGERLGGATFRLRAVDGTTHDVTTDDNGTAIITDLNPGTYTLIETRAPNFYIPDDTPRTVIVREGQHNAITITNRKMPSVAILKKCSVTGNPLQATFEVRVKNGRSLGTFTTDPITGLVALENLEYTSDPLILEITERVAPSGYHKSTETREISLRWGESRIIEWFNTPENPILIYKRDVDGNPIGNTEFLVTTVNGAHVATVKTDRTTGVAVVAGLELGWYSVRETRPGSDEFILDSTPKLVELKAVGSNVSPAVVEFVNDRKPQLQIRKLNSADNSPMQSVLIRINRMDGAHIGDYRTDAQGLITLTTDPGWVTVFELETLKGFVLNQKPVNVELRVNRVATVELFNDPLPGLQLRKTCSVSGKPLESVQYQFKRLNGSVIGIYETDAQGIIYLDINEKFVVITELKTVNGYRLDGAPRTVELTSGELTIVSYQNTPFPILELVKLDSHTKQPIQNIRFKVFDRNMRELGTFSTNNLGRIILTGMDEGRYYVREYDVSAAGPYVIDKTVHEIMLYNGKTTTITLYNEKMGTLRIKKVCSVSGQLLPGATFLMYDARNNVLGEYTTNALGIIELDSSLEPQKLKLKEIKSPAGWVLDSTVHEFEVKANATTEITLTNDPVRGTIQIVKKAAAANDITKHKTGAVLAGAVFEVVNEKLEVVDTITTNSRGIATTKPLPIGKYAIQEKKSPDYYILDDSIFYAEIKLHNDVVRFEVLNDPADISVTVEKRGNVEALPGDLIRYDLSNISNSSNISLNEFYLHDQLPTDAVRLETLATGTWSERLTYRVTYRTNLKKEYRVWRGNLLTTVNHELDVSDLKLAANEFVTDIRMEFGTVQPGFQEKDAPYLMTRVLDGLPHEHRFVNRVTVGGKVGNEIIYNTDSWVTIAFSVPRGPLPRTGL